MKIGLSFDLKSEYLDKGYSQEQIAELDIEETIEAIENALQEAGHQVERIGGLENLMRALLQGKRWELVFNIAEGMHGMAREAQIPCLLDAYQIPYVFSDSAVLALTMNKAMTNAVLRCHDVRVSDFQVLRQENDLSKVAMPYPLFVKPLAEGSSKGISENSLVRNAAQLAQSCRELWRQSRQPLMLERYLCGREFTVGLLGSAEQTGLLAVMEVTLNHKADSSAYTYANKQQYEERVKYQTVEQPEVAKLAMQAWRILNCRDAGRVDLRMDQEGRPHFLEVNPLAGLNPKYSDLCIMCRQIGIPYNCLIQKILASAMKRL